MSEQPVIDWAEAARIALVVRNINRWQPLVVSYESIRQWAATFGPQFAQRANNLTVPFIVTDDLPSTT